jgi:4-hydroxy-tetrahydrodipicolinate synthase
MNTKGVYTAILTPFDENGKIDFNYLERHLRFQEANGIDGVVACGTNGEGPSLSLDERRQIINFVIQYKGNMQVIAGTGCANLPETIELSSFAAEAGADAALILPPFFYKNIEESGLVDYYNRVLNAVDLPVILYNIPLFSGIEITDNLISALIDRPNFNLIGVKDTSGDIKRTKSYIVHFPKLHIFNGTDKLIKKALESGAVGTISGISNIVPKLVSRIYADYTVSKDVTSLQQQLDELIAILGKYPMFAANKFALILQGFPPTHVRPPLVDMTQDQYRQLEAKLRAYGYSSTS